MQCWLIRGVLPSTTLTRQQSSMIFQLGNAGCRSLPIFLLRKLKIIKAKLFVILMLSYIYLINQARGLYWENISPRSVQKRLRTDILPVQSRASLVNKRFITQLKRALKVFHKFHVTLCRKCYLTHTRCFHHWS